MGIRTFKPMTPSQRGLVRPDFAEITKTSPEKTLLRPLRKRAGRNSRGVITVRHRGGGHKRRYRIIDFKRRDKEGIPGRVAGIEYDPNRSARIALLYYRDGEKRYILWPLGLKLDDVISCGPDAEIRVGNALPLRLIPLGAVVHNIELQPGHGAQMVRSAGGSAQIMAREERYTQIRLPSGEIRRVLSECYATLGEIGNAEHQATKIGKAGRQRWLGHKPQVRGKAMSPRDHPHGGGEGGSPIGLKHPKTPGGKAAIGRKTRRNKMTSKFIVRRRRIGYGQKR